MERWKSSNVSYFRLQIDNWRYFALCCCSDVSSKETVGQSFISRMTPKALGSDRKFTLRTTESHEFQCLLVKSVFEYLSFSVVFSVICWFFCVLTKHTWLVLISLETSITTYYPQQLLMHVIGNIHFRWLGHCSCLHLLSQVISIRFLCILLVSRDQSNR